MPSRIVVVGIYRSGTSLTTKLVHRWGAYVGHDQDLFQDQYGYMEHFALQKLNDELLGNNELVPPLPDVLAKQASDPAYKERALQILERMDKEAEENRASTWVWKDPRLPLVLPFWAHIWGDVVYVIPVRHPKETILSGAQMEGMAPESVPFSAGFVYWQHCMLNILAFTQSSRRKIFIAYDQLLRNPRQECARLCRFLDEQCGAQTADADQRIDKMASEIATNQRHYDEPSSLAEMEQTTKEQRALYNFLRVKTIYPNETFNKDDFAPYPGWREYLQTMEMLLTLSKAQET